MTQASEGWLARLMQARAVAPSESQTPRVAFGTREIPAHVREAAAEAVRRMSASAREEVRPDPPTPTRPPVAHGTRTGRWSDGGHVGTQLVRDIPGVEPDPHIPLEQSSRAMDTGDWRYQFRLPNGGDYIVTMMSEAVADANFDHMAWAQEQANRAWRDIQLQERDRASAVADQSFPAMTATTHPKVTMIESDKDVESGDFRYAVLFEDGEVIRLRVPYAGITTRSRASEGLNQCRGLAITMACEWRKLLRWLPLTPEQRAVVLDMDQPLPEVILPSRRMDAPEAESAEAPHRVRKSRVIDNL